MKKILLPLLLLPIISHAQDVEHNGHTLVVADINCDGADDQARLERNGSNVVVSVVMGGTGAQHALTFGIAQGTRQDSLCGTPVSLSAEAPPQDNDDVFVYGLGEVPDGHIYSAICHDLRLSGGECDAIHIYWNHRTGDLSWWRL